MTEKPNEKFKWDYPTQGMTFHRSIDQAFKTGAVIQIQRRFQVTMPDAFAYTIAVILLAATAFIWFN